MTKTTKTSQFDVCTSFAANGNRLLCHIGKTPLVRLKCHDLKNSAQVWCKLEYMNPGGSIKDRMCKAIIEGMEADGQLKPGDLIIEASAGNTAISLAMIAAAKGYPLMLVMPETVSVERRRLLASYGADIVLTPPSNGMKGAVTRAVEITESKKRARMINQFENPLNPAIHRETTATEIIRDLGKTPDIFVAGVGTGGTITGVGELFKEKNVDTRIVAVEPAESPILSGGNPGPSRIPGLGAGFIPRVLNTGIIDEVIAVTYQDAVKTTEFLAEKEGLCAGLSSGAAVYGAIKQAENKNPDKVVVTILYDSGERYLYS